MARVPHLPDGGHNGGMTTRSARSEHEIPALSVDELRHTQTEGLRATVRAAYGHVLHHREAFDAKGTHPEDITSVADLAPALHGLHVAYGSSRFTGGLGAHTAPSGSAPPSCPSAAV